MKKIILILFSLLAVLLFCACGGGDGGETVGTAPKITNAQFYDEYWNPKWSFSIDDLINFEIWAEDPDLDMKTLYITQYYPADSPIIYRGPDTMFLPSQSTTAMVYFNIEPWIVTEPAGSWRVEFEIEDSKANSSNIFTVYVSVTG